MSMAGPGGATESRAQAGDAARGDGAPADPARGLSRAWADVVPTIEASCPGVESVVLPHGGGWLSHEGLPVRAYVVGDAREVLLVDAGYGTRLSFEAIVSAVAGRKVRAILLTHRHKDHGGGAAALAARFGAAVHAHPLEATTMGADAACPVAPLGAGDVFEAGGRRLTVVDAAGHSRGHVAFHEAASGLLFTGDTVLGEGTVMVGPPDGDMATYMATLERLRALAPLTRILPGHGPRVDDPAARLELYVRHRHIRERQIWQLLSEAPRTAASIVDAVYAATTPDAMLPLALVSALGTLEKLRREGRASEEGGVWRASLKPEA